MKLKCLPSSGWGAQVAGGAINKGTDPRTLTQGCLSIRSPSPLEDALTVATDVPKVPGGSFLVPLVAEHTDEAGAGQTQGQAQSQGPGVGGCS